MYVRSGGDRSVILLKFIVIRTVWQSNSIGVATSAPGRHDGSMRLRSSSEVNTTNDLLHSGYIVLQQGTYDLKCSSSSEGHMGQCDSSDIKFMFHQHMEAVIIIAMQNDDQEEESDEQEEVNMKSSNLSVEVNESLKHESLLLQVKLCEDFYSYFEFYFNIFGSLSTISPAS